jgi:hypothetical protein
MRAAVVIAAVALAGCGTAPMRQPSAQSAQRPTTTTTSTTTTTTRPRPTTTTTTIDISELALDLTFDNMTDAKRAEICGAYLTLGPAVSWQAFTDGMGTFGDVPTLPEFTAHFNEECGL